MGLRRTWRAAAPLKGLDNAPGIYRLVAAFFSVELLHTAKLTLQAAVVGRVRPRYYHQTYA